MVLNENLIVEIVRPGTGDPVPDGEVGEIVITSLDLNAKDRERLNSGVQSVLIKEMFRPAELVERIRRLVHRKPVFSSGMEAAS